MRKAVQQTRKYLPWEEMFSQILSSTVPTVCLHASFQNHYQRRVVVLRITAQHKVTPVCCHSNINYQIILDNDPSNLVFFLLQWQAATSLKRHWSPTMKQAEWYSILHFLLDLSLLVLHYVKKSWYFIKVPNKTAQVILNNINTEL